jgi:hypothetical protein
MYYVRYENFYIDADDTSGLDAALNAMEVVQYRYVQHFTDEEVAATLQEIDDIKTCAVAGNEYIDPVMDIFDVLNERARVIRKRLHTK